MTAAVIVRDGTTDDDLAAHLAAFTVPKRLFLTDAIPKTGKVQRRLVVAAFTRAA